MLLRDTDAENELYDENETSFIVETDHSSVSTNSHSVHTLNETNH